MSYALFADTLTGITVTGVKRAYTAPPTQISTADLPALFPRLPQGSTAIDTLGRTSGLLTMTCDLVLIVEPVMQNRATANYTASLALMDALDTALRTAATSSTVLDRWTIQMLDETIGDTFYWAIVATVEGSEAI